MDSIFAIFAPVALCAAALASVAIWSRRALSPKLAAIALTGGVMATGYAGLLELLGRPQPIDMAWTAVDVAEARVLGSSMEEDVAIYVWLQLGDDAEPKSYVLPWSLDMAAQLQQAGREAEAEGGVVVMRRPFDIQQGDEQPVFYADPQQAPPPKSAG